MADIVKPSTGRRFLRPPTVVNRKSHSFNSADKAPPTNLKSDSSTNASAIPTFSPATNASLQSGQSEWRSKSLNAKHSATSKTIPSLAMPSKLVKKSSTESNGKMHGPNHLVKVESSSKVPEPTSKQRLVKMKATTNASKPSLKIQAPPSNRTQHGAELSGRTSRSAVNETSSKTGLRLKTSSKTTGSGLVPPKASASRSTSNSSRGSTAATSSPDKKSKSKTKTLTKNVPANQAQTKSGGSVFGKLRKMGGPSNTIPNDSNNGVMLKQAVPVKSPVETSKSFTKSNSNIGTLEKKRGLVPPSTSYKGRTIGKPATHASAANNNNVKPNSGIKSTFQKAFGGTTKQDKKASPKPTTAISKLPEKSSPVAKRLASDSSAKHGSVVKENPDVTKRFSGEETFYRRDKIDVQNLKSLLVRPYDNVRIKKEEQRVPSPISLSENDLDLSDDGGELSVEVEIDVPELAGNAEEIVENVPKIPKQNHENGIRNIQLPSSSDERKPLKTATVAPFRRQAPSTCVNGIQDLNVKVNGTPIPRNDTEKEVKPGINQQNGKLEDKPMNQAPVNTSVSMEVRRQTAKGIADLRQNLEETMCSLRNSQLRNRMSDEFERRISAQLDAEIEEISLPEVPPPLSSNSSFRSSSSISGVHTISHGTRSPKLHAGECLGPSSYTSPRPGKYSSLQRTQSSRTTRPAWNETNERPGPVIENGKDEDDKSLTDDISSVSSEDLSEYIAGISTDDISLSSANNSPYHCAKSAAGTNPISSLAKSQAIDHSLESLDKSSVLASESSRSISWKKSKKGLKSSEAETKSKKKLEKKNSDQKAKENSGSPAVGNRLASIDRSDSPTTTHIQPSSFSRESFAYRSLPRSRAHDTVDGGQETKLKAKQPSNNQEGFVRSPALKILLRSKANKSKAGMKPGLSFAANTTQSSTTSAPHEDYLSSTPNSKFTTNEDFKKSESDLEYRLGFYNSLERKNRRNFPGGLSMAATQSLPRRFAKRAGNTTWSSSRSNANSAYSLPATPDDNIYDQFGSYIDTSTSCSESGNSFSNLTVPDFDNFSDAMNKSFQDRNKMPDWPLSRLQPCSAVAASSPNVARAAFSDRSYRTISSTHDLAKRRGSSMSLGGALSNTNSDENSIAMARAFLYSLAQDKAVQQAHLVQEFEKSLSHLTSRLRELSTTAEEKDTELKELRNTIEQLKNETTKSDSWQNGKLNKKPSCGSLSSMSSQTSISSAGSIDEGKSSKKKRHWLKNSFKSAFGRSKSKVNLSTDDGESRSSSPQKSVSGQEVMSISSFDEESCDPDTVRKLKEELRQKERKLTDIRLEALTSRHQLQHLQDVMSQMKNEMHSLRKENEQLHQLGLSAYSLTSSSTFLHSKLNSVENTKSHSEELRVKIIVEISSLSIVTSKSSNEYITINTCPLSKTVNWTQLDQKIIKIFMSYCQTVDPTNCMKLTKDSIESYRVGEGFREIGMKTPEMLPCGYLVGDVDTIVIQLQSAEQGSVDLLAFELMMDKTIVEKYVEIFMKKQRIIISGPIGTGKSLLANRLAGFMAASMNLSERGTVIHMDAKQKASSELQDFLNNLAASINGHCQKPTVIVLDNLQSCTDCSKLLEPLCSSAPAKNLYITCVTNGKLDPVFNSFGQITCANNFPPVQSFLARKLRRSYLEHQIMQHQKPDEVLSLVITWLPKCWQHINDFLESHNSSDVTIGPRMFSSCPMDAASARVWFTDLWNFSVVPYVISAVKRSPNRKNPLNWTDPTQWVLETMPWHDNAPNLHQIRAEDVGPSPTESDNSFVTSQSSGITSQSSHTNSQSSSDPLLNMLMRLQEAVNYDSDTNSSHEDGFELSIDKALSELGS